MEEPRVSDAGRHGTLAHQAQVKHIVFGAMLIAAGAVLFFDHRDVFEVFTLWPLLLVGLGLTRILGGCCAHCRRGGFWLLAVGLWLALNQFTILTYHDTWPLLLIAVGGLVAWNAVAPSTACALCLEGRHGR